MKANSDKSKQSNKATRRVLAGVLCGASVLSLVLSLVMPPISQAIANDAQTVSTEETVMGGVPIVLSTVFSVELPRFSPCWRQPIGAAALFHFCGARPRRGPCPA